MWTTCVDKACSIRYVRKRPFSHADRRAMMIAERRGIELN